MKSLCLLCVLCVLCVKAFALDRTAFTFTRYDLEVRVDPEGHALAARGKLRLRNDSSASQRNLALQISSSLAWRMILLDGNPVQYLAQPYTTDIDHTGDVSEAVVTLPSAVPPKGEVELEVGYQGLITRDATRLTHAGVPAQAAAHNDWDQVAEPVTAVRGIGYVAWYPVSLPAAGISGNLFALLDNWKTSQRDTTMRVNLCWVSEANLTVVANGPSAGVTRHLLGPGEQVNTNTGCSTYIFTALGTTVPTFAIADYSTLSRPAIDVYHLTPQAPAAQEYALAAEKVLPFESDWFGAPHAKVTVVQLPEIGDAPFESGPLLFTPLEMRDRNSLQLRMMHQLVHASVTSPRPWINEGLAQFGEALEREQQGSRSAALAYLQTFLPPLQAAEAGNAAPKNGPVVPRPGLINSTDEIMYRVKAMYVWWMLRDMLGDAALQQAIRRYHVSGDKDAAYMPRLIEQAAHRDLEWFFDDWVYRDRGLPDFRIEAAFPRVTLNGSYVVTVTVANDGHAGAEVPVSVRAPGGERGKRMLVKAEGKEVDRIEMPEAPSEAVVNDGSVPEANTKNNSLRIVLGE